MGLNDDFSQELQAANQLEDCTEPKINLTVRFGSYGGYSASLNIYGDGGRLLVRQSASLNTLMPSEEGEVPSAISGLGLSTEIPLEKQEADFAQVMRRVRGSGDRTPPELREAAQRLKRLDQEELLAWAPSRWISELSKRSGRQLAARLFDSAALDMGFATWPSNASASGSSILVALLGRPLTELKATERDGVVLISPARQISSYSVSLPRKETASFFSAYESGSNWIDELAAFAGACPNLPTFEWGSMLASAFGPMRPACEDSSFELLRVLDCLFRTAGVSPKQQEATVSLSSIDPKVADQLLRFLAASEEPCAPAKDSPNWVSVGWNFRRDHPAWGRWQDQPGVVFASAHASQIKLIMRNRSLPNVYQTNQAGEGSMPIDAKWTAITLASNRNRGEALWFVEGEVTQYSLTVMAGGLSISIPLNFDAVPVGAKPVPFSQLNEAFRRQVAEERKNLDPDLYPPMGIF